MIAVKIAAIVLISAATVLAFVTTPPLAMLATGGRESRIFYFHVPMAQLAFLSFMIAAGYAIALLRTRNPAHDDGQTTAAELGLLYSVVAMITGAIWARQAWGAYWNWDPRQLFLFVLVLFYAAFFALRQATPRRETRQRLSAVYLIFGGAISPLLFFVLPRMFRSLHEDANQVIISPGWQINMSGTVGVVFTISFVGFLMLYVWLFKLGRAAARIRSAEERGVT
jgi:heme exporter protein C